MREAEVHRLRAAIPAQAQHVAHHDECLRADQNSTMAKEAPASEFLDRSEVLGRDAVAAQGYAGLSSLTQGPEALLENRALLKLVDETLNACTLGPYIDRTPTTADVSEVEVEIGLALDLSAVKGTAQGSEPRSLNAPSHVEQLGVRGLCAEGEVGGERAHCYHTNLYLHDNE